MARWLRVLTYPLVTTGACATFYALAKSGAPTVLAAYPPVLTAAAVVTALEVRHPYRRTWHPSARTVAADVGFMVFVQMALPAVLSITFALVAEQLASDSGWQLRQLWPHSLPSTAQVVLMVFVADLPRYWLHRAAHHQPWLWRLHAVHHRPGELYWLNVGRFHPVEKVLQALVDSLPFVILGVGHWVLAGYFVFYAVNGFFQHSNCDVSLGPLNHLVSGPELHRWHHSVELVEANHNYGNNVIVWDTLFGTRWLPAGREVGEIGVR
ncbi:MAG: sterol desaturase family protein [Acidimicrobiales bacterium]|nr:sterol desaturase family protein [Acidimicrobiales bacterium]